ncbi:uncharacterized protein LOC120465281 [Pimephales promelas]|uniref:uncharacterized protein LOC120465281 n=1 Tax=Pimephales promelas TaxID=90988 RepID=UPI00195587C4|nr:uncharacterized protein LOC120465281 [Pimephales promelas]KAG1934663.1 hypothetical protein F2P79_019876 [Pimephales promelas]
MEAADTLCESLFCWLENREECAEELEKLEQEPEDVPQRSNITQGFRASISAAFASVCPTSTLVKAGVSSSIFNKAKELMKEDEKVGTSIQEQLRDLKDECGGAPNADELDCEVTTRLMWALARRSNTPVPLDFLRGFNKATFFRHLAPGGLDPAEASDFICQALGLDRSPEITSSLKMSAKEMMENIGRIGTKAAKEGSRGATGLGISLCDLIVKSEALVKGNRVPGAGEILDGQRKLKEQLGAMQEIIQKLFRLKNLVKELGEYSLCMTQNEWNIMNYIRGTCTDDRVVSWLQGSSNQTEFVNLLRFCLERLSFKLPDLELLDKTDLDIVIVGHGGILDQFMPAGGLVPTPNITDTVLYSPWNCPIDSKAAYAIAQGFIQATDRVFRHMAYYEPNPLPDHWNSMRRSPSDIPVILLSPLTPEEDAWALFQQFWVNNDMDSEDRVILPYLLPQDQENAFGEIPLFMFILALSYILSCHGKAATVHLAACLCNDESPLMEEEWVKQYAYTSDGAYMTVSMDDRNMNNMLFMALRSLFDRKRR